MTFFGTILAFLTSIINLFKKYPWQCLFGIALLVIFFLETCRTPCSDPLPCPEYDTVWVKGDSIPYPDTVYIPRITWQDTGSTKYVWHDVDTATILLMFKDYLVKRFYLDTLMNDTNGTIILADSIYQNQLQHRSVFKEILPHYVHVTKTITLTEEPKNILYLGGSFGGWSDHTGMDIKASLLNKKKQLWTVSYDPFNPNLRVGVQFPIRFRK